MVVRMIEWLDRSRGSFPDDERRRGSVLDRGERLFLTKTFRLALGPIQPLTNWVLGAVSRVDNTAGT